MYLVIHVRPNDRWDDYYVRLEACLSEIKHCMYINMLRLNTDNTELIVFSPKSKSDTTEYQLHVSDNIVKAVPVVRNLGAMFDSGLLMERQINAVMKSCLFQIRTIGCNRKHISTKACKV